MPKIIRETDQIGGFDGLEFEGDIFKHATKTGKEATDYIAKKIGNETVLFGNTASEQIFTIGFLSKKDRSNNESKKKEKVIFTKEQYRAKTEVAPGISYHEEFTTREEIKKAAEGTPREDINIARKKLIIEYAKLPKLAQVSKETNQLTVEQPPSDPGTYHLNFIEWTLSLLKQAGQKQKLENSHSWLETVKGKNEKKKQGFWNRAKNEGTKFTQNMDRTPATATG
jgi:hypothetical protein